VIIYLKIILGILYALIITGCWGSRNLGFVVGDEKLEWYGKPSNNISRVWTYGVGKSWLTSMRNAQSALLLQGSVQTKTIIKRKQFRNYIRKEVDKVIINEIPRDMLFGCNILKTYLSPVTGLIYTRVECIVTKNYDYKVRNNK